ncbi:hypothetical protein TNIN_5571 [Trichonephila inaurata madagascariensis]|uniref:DUF19 domain-containing protein n=1 Tax=Trichonephila inaurata madagascariensis TaxID=2747483 RepID=A0A8X7CG03_9ARAC|nr:hypothetical protein TNIN_5571 [Trichonephila inaurata madagascariensis]
MWGLCVILLTCAFGNAFASEEEFCATEPLKACKFEVNENLIPYTESKLIELCKKLDDYYKCTKDHKFSAGEVCGWPFIIKSAEAMVGELCYKKTSLKSRYLMNIVCIMDIINDSRYSCGNSSETVYGLLTNLPGHEMYQSEKKQCMKSIYELDCYGHSIKSSCSPDSYLTFNEFVTRTNLYGLHCKDFLDFNLVVSSLIYMSEHSHINNIQPHSIILPPPEKEIVESAY